MKLGDNTNKRIVHSYLCEILNDTYYRKNRDYGDSFAKSFIEYGETMAAIRLEDKLNRFKSLMKKDALVDDESIADTLLDLANYAIMTVIEMKGDEFLPHALAALEPTIMKIEPTIPTSQTITDHQQIFESMRED